jgi:ABC-2 type transport system ATP-binding protein
MKLELLAATHRYPGAREAAVRQVTAAVGPGVTGLVGVNGAGKSTLLRMLSRGQRPTSGHVRLDGRDLYGRGRQAAAQVSLMPQDFRVPGEARVLDVLLYCAWLKGVRRRVALARGLDLLDRVGLADRAHHRMGRLSGGMVRRVALAQALISRPRLILLDEPTTGLDPEQRASIRSLLVEELTDLVTAEDAFLRRISHAG